MEDILNILAQQLCVSWKIPAKRFWAEDAQLLFAFSQVYVMPTLGWSVAANFNTYFIM
jgi:hypothetical protein